MIGPRYEDSEPGSVYDDVVQAPEGEHLFTGMPPDTYSVFVDYIDPNDPRFEFAPTYVDVFVDAEGAELHAYVGHKFVGTDEQ